MKFYGYKVSKETLILLTVLFIILIFNLFSLINFFFFPNKNQPDTDDDKYFSYKARIVYNYATWLSYILFFSIILVIFVSQSHNIIVKIICIALFLFIIVFPVIPIINIINIILFLTLNNPPFIQDVNREFPLNANFETYSLSIKKEYLQYSAKVPNVGCLRDINPFLINIDTIDVENNRCWRTVYLKKKGELITELSQEFPITMSLVADSRIHNAFFSILDAKVDIKSHIGYYKGYLRYHLGVVIPEEHGQFAYIVCGGERYEWREGKGVIFDDMFLHYVKNPTNKQRVVLYLDIKRKDLNPLTDFIVESGNYLIENSAILNIFIKNQHVQSKTS